LTAQPIGGADAATVAGAIAGADVRRRVDASVSTGNPELLAAALRRRGRRAPVVPAAAATRAAAARS
jgi:hypothetical protein